MHHSTRPKAHRRWRWFLLLNFISSVSLGLRGADLPQQPNVATNRYEFHQPHDPAGIGKFYMGREIAQVMGHEAADWLERPERDREEHTELLVEELNLKPGEIVADIGVGTGYFSRRLARKVGATGKVLAVDIQPEMLALFTNTMAADGLTNVVPILGSTNEPYSSARSS